MDRASQVLAQARLDVPMTYAALADRGGEKAQSQQYLTPDEEKAVIKFLLLMSNLGQLVRIKYIPSLAFYVARNQLTNKPIKPPGKNWPRGFEKRYLELKAKTVKAINWKRHGNNIYDKI
ncbi:uncharacterized protein BDZ99DRAFT_370393, partial [Mytilinidion resinicola]